MARKNKIKFLENVEITDVADRGKAVGRVDGKVVFVEGAVPGDIVDVRVFKKKKGFFQAKTTKVVKASPDRIDPFCSHFGTCGGCKWQYLDYEAQLRHKQTTVENALKRIGKVEVEEWLPILGSAENQYYRNKLEFTFSNKKWLTQEQVDSEEEFDDRDGLGFHIAGFFDKVVDIEHCYLQPEPSNKIRNQIREWAYEKELTFYNIREHVGLLRNLIVRTTTTGDLMVILSLGEDQPENCKWLMEQLKVTFPEITSLNYVVNLKKNDTLYDQNIICYSGEPFIKERLNHVIFKLGPKSFFQTNTKQAEQLYATTAEFAALTGDETVYDLYTGIGSIACYVAEQCKTIVGIEEVPEAIEDAKENAALNKLDNTAFYAGDVKDLLTNTLVDKHGRPDLIITDPPRAGMHAKVVDTLLELESPRIVYVSCNPATQARDLQLLSEKYKVVKSKAVDMFPHTHHIENVVSLILK